MIRSWSDQLLPYLPLLLFSPFFLFPTHFPWILVPMSAALLTVYTAVEMSREGRTVLPLTLMILIFASLIPVGYLSTAQKAVSTPKLGLLFFGLVTCWFFGRSRDSQEPFDLSWLGSWAYAGGILVLGLLGPFVTVFRMPHKILDIRSFQGTILQTGEVLDVNILGCLLAIGSVLALVVAQESRKRGCPRPLFQAGALLGFVLALLTVLTQARAAMLGLGIGLAVVTGIMWRRARIPLFAGFVVGAILLVWIGPWKVISAVSMTERLTSMEYRLELWNRASYAIQDFPFTGIGPGMFDKVVPQIYPFFEIPLRRTPFHSHNLYLQIALDHGIPGLLAFMSLLGFSLVLGVRAIQAGRTMAVGYLGAIVVVLMNGILDSPLWLNKPHPVLFFLMGMMIALGSGLARRRQAPVGLEQGLARRSGLQSRQKEDAEVTGAEGNSSAGLSLPSGGIEGGRGRTPSLAVILLIPTMWILMSLASISFVGDSLAAAGCIAILGGLYIGWEAAQLMP